jgi:hypothetical protein
MGISPYQTKKSVMSCLDPCKIVPQNQQECKTKNKKEKKRINGE